MAFEEEIKAYVTKAVQKRDFKTAAGLMEQLESLRAAGPKDVSSQPEGREDRRVADRARAERLALEEEIKAYVTKHDFQAAADPKNNVVSEQNEWAWCRGSKRKTLQHHLFSGEAKNTPGKKLRQE